MVFMAQGGRLPCDAVPMLEVLALPPLQMLSDDRVEYRVHDRLLILPYTMRRRLRLDVHGFMQVIAGSMPDRRLSPKEKGQAKQRIERVILMFGDKNHIGFIRRSPVTDAARYDGGQLGRRLDTQDTAIGVLACCFTRLDWLEQGRLIASCEPSSAAGRRKGHIDGQAC